MAKEVVVKLYDDLDETQEADETVVFELDGARYEIDLSADNAARLRDGLVEFVGAARRTGGRLIRGAGTRAPARSAATADHKERLARIRDWAREQGHDVAPRGRIRADIIAAFDEAEQESATPMTAAPTRKRRTA